MSDGSTVETAETRLRSADSASAFSFVVLVEGIGVHQLEAAMPDVVNIAAAASSGSCEVKLVFTAWPIFWKQTIEGCVHVAYWHV